MISIYLNLIFRKIISKLQVQIQDSIHRMYKWNKLDSAHSMDHLTVPADAGEVTTYRSVIVSVVLFCFDILPVSDDAVISYLGHLKKCISVIVVIGREGVALHRVRHVRKHTEWMFAAFSLKRLPKNVYSSRHFTTANRNCQLTRSF